jgi:hypothetical protein
MCDLYKGENYCGAEPSRIHFMAMKCDTGKENIMDCYRELADGCGHD